MDAHSLRSDVAIVRGQNEALREEAQALREQTEALREELRAQPVLLRALEATDPIHGLAHAGGPPAHGRIQAGGAFMSRAEYAKLLREHNLIELSPGAPHEGQHVFHIISAANGGPDHTDNFLYALGGSFNVSIGCRLDAFNCVLAGKAKARRAVAIALLVAREPTLRKHVDRRGKAEPALLTNGAHRELCQRYPNDADALADALYAQGDAILRDVRHANR